MTISARTMVTTRSVSFIAITFVLSSVSAGAGYWLLQRGYPAAGQATAIFMMSCPGIAGVVCALLFERGRRLHALGIVFRPNWGWLLAYLGGVGFSGIALATNIFIGRSTTHLPHNIYQFSIAFLLTNPLVQTILATIEEELGWRGYLYYLWREAGFWQYSLWTGLMWGIWHAPGIILFKANYPDAPWTGALAFVLLCMLIAPLMTLIRDKGKSVIAAGICHGTLDATDIASTVIAKNSSPLWQGDGGIGGFVSAGVFAVGIALFQRYGTSAQSLRTHDKDTHT